MTHLIVQSEEVARSLNTPTDILSVFDAMQTRLATLNDPTELLPELERSKLLAHLARGAKLGLQAQNHIATHRLRVERRLGEELKQLSLDRQSVPAGNTMLPGRIPTLKELGISKMQSFRLQRIALISNDIFFEYIQKTSTSGREITAAGLKRFADQQCSEPAANTSTLFTFKSCDSAADLSASGGATTRIPTPQQANVYPSVASLIEARRTFGCIYIDPPWSCEMHNGNDRATAKGERPTIEDICALPVGQIASPVSHLHLWTDSARLKAAIKVIDAWGFKYKSVCVWVRSAPGAGDYWCESHDLCLLATRGAAAFESSEFMSWFEDDAPTDGTKPEAMRDRIEIVSPGPYVELFARREVPGWTAVQPV